AGGRVSRRGRPGLRGAQLRVGDEARDGARGARRRAVPRRARALDAPVLRRRAGARALAAPPAARRVLPGDRRDRDRRGRQPARRRRHALAVPRARPARVGGAAAVRVGARGVAPTPPVPPPAPPPPPPPPAPSTP